MLAQKIYNTYVHKLIQNNVSSSTNNQKWGNLSYLQIHVFKLLVHGISHNVYGLVRIDIDIRCLKMTKKPENVFHKNCSRYKIIISASSSKSLNTQSKCQFRKPDFFNLLRPNVKIARTHDMMLNGIQEEELATLHILLWIQRVNIQK